MGFVIGLVFGAAVGIIYMALCTASGRKDAFTNADRLAMDTEHLAQTLYNADDFEAACPLEYGESQALPKCCESRACIHCIREWLIKEADEGYKD